MEDFLSKYKNINSIFELTFFNLYISDKVVFAYENGYLSFAYLFSREIGSIKHGLQYKNRCDNIDDLLK